jgi:hypothetical protein
MSADKHTDNDIFQKLSMFKKELEEIMREHGLSAVGLSARDAADFQRNMNTLLIDKINEQTRHIAWMLGEKIESKIHFGEAVIIGEGVNFG